ncbi:MAG: asparaginyl/glutamyl-tRNA amidotransferase subunit C [Deltaproteobacteria bacterium GWA2_45_12]|nr:MAG: asparaginyl/glutamyl-tRNA amidotransferase subunit C [Deltaproteobacteria bacterium GWA2_45_12]
MITLKEVEKIAHLSKLSLSESEKQKFVVELGNILGFVEKLDQLDLKNVAATSHAVEVTNVFREDKIVNTNVKEKALAMAPEAEGDFFRVPKVL